jgi:hypothetical protein
VGAVASLAGKEGVSFAAGGLTGCPAGGTLFEGFTASGSEDGRDYTDAARECPRVVMGWNPAKKRIILAGYSAMSAARGRDALAYLGCAGGITLDAGGSAAMRVKGEYLLTPEPRKQFGMIYWA